MNIQTFEGEHDVEGVYVYQAYCNEIADYAVTHQTLGGTAFKTHRMTWIKPSFAWVLYRSGYATKHNQNRILKIKLPHDALAKILNQCACKVGGGGSYGRVQWDPARDLYSVEDKNPRKMLNKRAIQIGVKDHISQFYVSSILSIEDVTCLAHLVGVAHNVINMDNNGTITKNKKRNNNVNFDEVVLSQLPNETAYVPHCENRTLENIGMREGDVANDVAKLGKGRWSQIK